MNNGSEKNNLDDEVQIDHIEKTEKDLEPTTEELREFYITPVYIDIMTRRASFWSTEHLKKQILLFSRTIPDYPEVIELLEGELHKRNLNKLLRHIRSNPNIDLKALLNKYGGEPDYHEIIMTELEIRKGVKHLFDSSGET